MSDETNKTPSGLNLRKIGRGLVREIGIPLILALIVIQFVIQAFRIPSGSMERSLLVGDFLLGLKFVYGAPLPFSEKRLPALTEPKVDDIIIFHYPMDPDTPERNPDRYQFLGHTLLFGDYYWDRTPAQGQGHLVRYDSRDFIKRCVGVSGDTITLRRKHLYRNGQEALLPVNGKYDDGEPILAEVGLVRDSTGPFRIPTVGQQLSLDSLPLDEFMRIYSLAIQENPLSVVRCSLWVERNGQPLPDFVLRQIPQSNYPPFRLEQKSAENIVTLPGYELADIRIDSISSALSRHFIPRELPSGRVRNIAFEAPFPAAGFWIQRTLDLWNRTDTAGAAPLVLRKTITVDGVTSHQYTIKQRVLFMMGDNRDHSSDGRFWGYLSQRNVKARAFLVYFSIDNQDDAVGLNPFTWWKIPARIRWSRIGRIVHD